MATGLRALSKIFKDVNRANTAITSQNSHNIDTLTATKHEVFLENLCYSLTACRRPVDRGKCRCKGAPSSGTIDFRNILDLMSFMRFLRTIFFANVSCCVVYCGLQIHQTGQDEEHRGLRGFQVCTTDALLIQTCMH
jgi:hypothetical protein